MKRCYFKEKNSTGFFRFPRSVFQDNEGVVTGAWARLPSASKSILPAILVHANKAGFCYPSLKQIAAYAGVSENTVLSGIEGLKTLANFTVRKKPTQTGKFQNFYHFALPESFRERKAFMFNRVIVESGTWSLLNPTAKSLYPAMRHFSFPDPDSFNPDGSGFGDREFEICEAELQVLAACSGISTRRIGDALDALKGNGLVDDNGNSGTLWIYLKPFRQPDLDALNEAAERRLGKKANAAFFMPF